METLLLPGMDGTGMLFDRVARALPAALGARVVRYAPHRCRSYAELLEDLVVPAAPFALVAESFSGPLAIQLAARYPDRVRALVLVASFVRSPSLLAAWLRGPLGRRLFELHAPDLALRWALLGFYASADEVRELRRALGEVAPEVLASRLEEIASVDVRDELARCRAPLLYLAGKHDRWVGPRAIEEIRRVRPDVEVVVLDAPHLVLQRQPAAAARHIARFLLSESQ